MDNFLCYLMNRAFSFSLRGVSYKTLFSKVDYFLITTKEILSLLSDTLPFGVKELSACNLRTWTLRNIYNYIKNNSILKYPNYNDEKYRHKCLYYKLFTRKKEILSSVLYFNPNTLKHELSYLSKYTKKELYKELYYIELKIFVLKNKSPKTLKLGNFTIPDKLTVDHFMNVNLYLIDYHNLDQEWLKISKEECNRYYRLNNDKLKEIITHQQKCVKDVKYALKANNIPSDMFKMKYKSLLSSDDLKKIKKYSDYSLYIQWIDKNMAIDNDQFYSSLCEDFISHLKEIEEKLL